MRLIIIINLDFQRDAAIDATARLIDVSFKSTLSTGGLSFELSLRRAEVGVFTDAIV